jgi:NADPH-dependent 2,4-dienoyl-CoA reductase/sulfur reductase-like enzyme
MDVKKRKQIIIIGLGTGGLYSSKAATITDKDAEVTIIEQRGYDMFSPCGLPFAIEGEVESFDELVHTFPATRRINKLIAHKATGVDPVGKNVTVKDLETGETKKLGYDSLIISTGSKPITHVIPGVEKFLGRGAYIVSSIENSKSLKDAAEEADKAVVIGGGATGLETASALRKLGLDVVLIEMTETPLPRSLDPDMGSLIIEHLESKGVKTLFGRKVLKLKGDDKIEAVQLEGEDVETELVVAALGNSPNTEFLETSGLETKDGSIMIDERMQTSLEDVYAVGDCALAFFYLDKRPIKIELSTAAMEQGMVAGTNAAGGDMVYDGTLGTFVSKIGELEVAATGYNTSVAERKGFEVVIGKTRMKTKPRYIADPEEVTVKLVVDKKTRQVLGAQAIGGGGAAWRVNVAALAIKKRVKVDEFSMIELGYCPPVSDLYDPLHAAADVVQRRLARSHGSHLRTG